MKVTIKANSIFKRLQIWNGIFNLTNKELEVISAFIKVNITAKRKNLCSKTNKDEVAKLLNFDDPNDLNNYIKSFGSYRVNKLLNPNINHIEITIN